MRLPTNLAARCMRTSPNACLPPPQLMLARPAHQPGAGAQRLPQCQRLHHSTRLPGAQTRSAPALQPPHRPANRLGKAEPHAPALQPPRRPAYSPPTHSPLSCPMGARGRHAPSPQPQRRRARRSGHSARRHACASSPRARPPRSTRRRLAPMRTERLAPGSDKGGSLPLFSASAPDRADSAA